eukprot:PITA_17218
MVDAIASAGPGYKTSSYNALRGKELDEELDCVKEQLESIKSLWKFTGCSIMSDGWTNQRGRTIVNFVVACPKGTMFLKSIDASANVKDAHLIFSLLADMVEVVGVANVVQVITNNAANYVAVGRLLCAKYPTIFWTPCATHCIDLRTLGSWSGCKMLCMNANKLPAHWWIDCGIEAPQLQEFAIRVLGQPCSASSCEYNWSVYEHIHNKKRNMLEHERLEKLVFISYSL